MDALFKIQLVLSIVWWIRLVPPLQLSDPNFRIHRRENSRKRRWSENSPVEMVDGYDAARTICSICYKDLKTIIEDLQSISICGHVFHELCLQQWLEYCSSAKYTCPVCKQSCRASDVARIYSQSLGGVDESILHKKAIDCGEDAGVLRREVEKLEVKVSGLTSTLERQGKELRDLTDEYMSWFYY